VAWQHEIPESGWGDLMPQLASGGSAFHYQKADAGRDTALLGVERSFMGINQPLFLNYIGGLAGELRGPQLSDGRLPAAGF